VSYPEPPLPVPEDDALDAAASAVLDGVATSEEADLVASSPEGRARLATLRAVSEAVARPVPAQSPAAAARVMAAAIDASEGATGDTTSASATLGPSQDAGSNAAAARLAAIEAIYGADTAHGADRPEPASASRPAGIRDPRGKVADLRPPPSAGSARWLPQLSAVAAALVLLVGIGALLVSLLGRHDTVDQQSNAPEAGSAARTSLASPSKAAGGSPPVDANSAAGAQRELGPQPRSLPLPATGSGAAGLADSSPPVVDGGDFGSQTDVQALVQRAAAALDSAADPATSRRDGALPTDVQACVKAGPAAANEPVGALRYWAVGSFQGTPAVVLVYDRPGTPPRVLLVLARQGCTVMTTSPF